MNKDSIVQEFWTYSDPLCWIALKVGLQKNDHNTIKLGVVTGLSLWGILVLFALIDHFGSLIFSLSVIGIHVRLLMAIPLFFLCESLVVPRMRQFISDLVNFGIIAGNDIQHLASNIHIVNHLRRSWIAESVLLLFAYVMPLLSGSFNSLGGTGAWHDIFSETQGARTMAQNWYLWVCLPFFRFLVLRWAWHLCLWWVFLWFLRKIPLRLIPIHPDNTGGLGYLEVVYEHFLPLVLALSALLSATYAEAIHRDTINFEILYRQIPMFFLLIAVLFFLPLLIFTRKLWRCRIIGLSTYMALASQYVNKFDSKWIKDNNITSEPLLGTSDIQSLADLANSIKIVQGMRIIPVGKRLLISLAVSIIIPFLPLLFFKYRLDQLTIQLLHMVFSL